MNPDEAARAASDAVDAWCAANPAPAWPALPDGVTAADFTTVWSGTLEHDPASGETRASFTPRTEPIEVTYAVSCQHPDAQRVTTVDGEHAGWLCPNCDAVLPPEWLSYGERSRLLAESHAADHHGAPFMMVMGCPSCGEETMERYR